MKRKIRFGLMFLGILGICAGILGCGTGGSAKSSIPVEIGEHINFGNYQGEEIEWRVLDAKDGNVLLLSEYGLDVQPFHKESASDISWENCTLRQWLNDEFYESAFTDEEKEKIVLSTSEGFSYINPKVPGGTYTYSERDTEDKVFLLSYTEVIHYISDNIGDDISDSKKLCYPTEYVKNNSDIPLPKDACGWWTCSVNQQLTDRCTPMVVTAYGHIEQEMSVTGMISMQYAVRPAIWMKW